MSRRTFVALCAFVATTLPGAAGWQSIGPDGGYVQALAIDPRSPERVYCASYEYPDSARLFLSTDAGASWDEQGRVPDRSVAYLAVDPHSHARLYAGGRANTVYRSTDRGATWNRLGAAPAELVFGIAVQPDNAGRLFAATTGGVYRTTDAGATWSRLLSTTGMRAPTNRVRSWRPR